MSMSHSKPKFKESQADEIVKRVFNLTPCEINSLPSYDDQNMYISTADGGEYVLKIVNSEDSKNLTLIEVQTYVMSFLHQKGVPTQTSVPTTSGQLMSLEEADFGSGSQRFVVRLLTYLSGTVISKVPLTPSLLYEMGRTAAKMDQILQELDHSHLSVLQRDKFIWSLSSIPQLEANLHVLNGGLKEVVETVIHLYKSLVIPRRIHFRKCIIHGDLNDLNVLVQPDEKGGHSISGILDFGDLNSGYYVYELAIAMTYMAQDYPKPIEAGRYVIAGWESLLPLNEAEKECLYVLVMSRFCQSFVIGGHTVTLQPENTEYVLMSSRKGIGIFHQLWEAGKGEVEKVWFEVADNFDD